MSEQTPASRLWQVSDRDLAAIVVACEQKLRAGYAEMLAAVGESEQRGLGKSLGYKDTSAFLTDSLRISAREAKQRIEHAAATMPSSSLTGVPQPPPQAATGEALTAGDINAEHVHAITTTMQACPVGIPVEQREADERILVELARQAGPEAVRKAGRRLRSLWEQDTAPPEDKDREQTHPLRRLDITRRKDGSIRFTGELDAETAEELDGLLGPLAKPHKNPQTGEHDTRTPAERAGDALAEIIALAARCDELGTQGGERAVMIVSINLAELENRARHAFLNIPGLSNVDGLRRLACESKVVPAIFGNNAAPLYVGDASRFATPAQRRYLTARDRGCAFPGCTRGPKWTTPHHVMPWSMDKRTDADNLVLLCGRHHRVIHHTPWEVRMNGHLPEFIPPPWIGKERKPMRNLAHTTPPRYQQAA
ncbi:HNH endonuclease signature motif containing protein [Amycolatopsis taiwanensis]|uniref:HNH endonuclease n=1 Tax=Amycolatopsis taiwanensis TaxID=342230 RepID=A0A9W6RCG8_9PSEU|nr:HNH endonuclease signature motif containing protein [Amycolatopsis taiwanensis]GLY71552.1 HNH endonuclease [Amycolatopsis taiwanensis]